MNPISRLRVAVNATVVPLLNIPTPLAFTGPDASLTLCRVIAGAGVPRYLDRGAARSLLQALMLH